MKKIRIHKAVAKELRSLGLSASKELADLLAQLAVGESLGLPVSRLKEML